MLQILIPETEIYDSENNLFIQVKDTNISLEHSLISISKWESFFHKSFIETVSKKPGMTKEESDYYIKCMTITQNVNPMVYKCLTKENYNVIDKYIEDPMTATTFKNDKKPSGKHTVITSELIYFWMITFNIPFECEKWHLNRLLTLINVCSIKNAPAKKMSRKDAYSQQNALNAARRAKYNSKG